jgi:hypothetical protein
MFHRFPVLKFLKIFLWLVAVHSLVVGVFLIVLPSSWLPFFGYIGYRRTFFQVQGGVFHLVMALSYSCAACDPIREKTLVIISLCAKGIAAIFLLLYYLFVESIWIVLLSAAGDALMGVIILTTLVILTKQISLTKEIP